MQYGLRSKGGDDDNHSKDDDDDDNQVRDGKMNISLSYSCPGCKWGQKKQNCLGLLSSRTTPPVAARILENKPRTIVLRNLVAPVYTFSVADHTKSDHH